MTAVNDAYINALLADASYVENELVPGVTGTELASKVAGRMTPANNDYGTLCN